MWRSDHALVETVDLAGVCVYHRATDLPNTLDYQFLTKVARLAAAAACLLAT